MTQTQTQVKLAGAAEHIHHWRIEEANGPTSSGECVRCGAVKEFRNWLSEADITTRVERELAA